MSIRYALFANRLTSGVDDYSAHVQEERTVGLEELVERFVEPGSYLKRGDALVMMHELLLVCQSLLAQGYRVDLGGIVQLHTSIKGTFDGPNDGFDESRHRVDVDASPGARLRKGVCDAAKVQKVEAILPAPVLVAFDDVRHKGEEGVVSCGGIGAVRGRRLKYDATKDDEGIYFVSPSGGVEVKVTLVQMNKPSELVFQNPESLVVGATYHIEVRARMNGGTELRTGRLDTVLTATGA